MAKKRICVLTGCQMEGLVSALQILLPDCEVEGFHTYRLRDPDGPELAARARSADLLFMKPLEPSYGALSEEEVRSACKRVQFVPQLVFPAYHPDLTYLPRSDGTHVQSPLTDYNSTIAVCGFLLGLSIERTLGLYNAYVYRTLGYFDLVARCRSDLIADFADYGIDLEGAVDRWIEHPDCFMYSTNHPKPHVLADVALAACQTAGLDVPKTFPCPDMMPDKLATWVMYPMFPEIAERVGKAGHYCFKALSFDRMNILGLEEFVERSFRAYETEDCTAWHLPPRLEASRDRLERLIAGPQTVVTPAATARPPLSPQPPRLALVSRG